MHRKLWLLAMIAGALLLAPGQAWACSCAMPGTPAEELARSEAVLAGRVVGLNVPQGAVIGTGDPVHVVFEVERVWKGPAYHSLVIVTARSEVSCGYSFEVGQEYLVYAYAAESELHTSICSRTALLAAAGEDLAALGPGMALLPAEPAAPPDIGSLAVPLILILAALLAGIALAMGAIKQARTRQS